MPAVVAVAALPVKLPLIVPAVKRPVTVTLLLTDKFVKVPTDVIAG